MRERLSRGVDLHLTLSEADLEGAGTVPRTTPRPRNLAEQVVVRRRGDLPGIEHWRVTASTRLWREYHERYAFCVGHDLQGAHAWKYRRRAYGVNTRTSTMLIAPGEVHVATHVPLASFQVLKVEPILLERELADEGKVICREFSGGQSDRPEVAEHFALLCRAIESSDADTFERRALLRQFLFAALSPDGDPQRKVASVCCEQAVKRVCEILRSQAEECLTLDFLECETNVSKYHLERSFHLRMGIPIHRYLKLVRLEKAQALLRRGCSAIEVAHATGFFDSAHMNRMFGAELGITPGRYARATRV